ncbi:MAG: molecular chaperone DnaJ [Candidatus Diapherotrites archaeon CG11_big_fil_rev_8_21_14_0_20_37_9]|nr:MAG: molecular chaperone DnaJ [Candidatus Diapherotrites archaeon CG11_big_fil_rev_8_21_14_0_20_37_9]
MAKDYYSILGINRDASQADIKSAYKKLAKKYHPDINKEADAEAKFKDVQHAYHILGDDQKRRSYNQFGEQGEKFGGQGGPGFQGFSGTGFEDIFESAFGSGFSGGFSDIFGSAFGGGKRGPARGEDIAIRMNITFEEAAFGTEKEIELDRIEECDNCKGSGARPGTKINTCTACNGSGVERKIRKTFLGVIQTQGTCSKCHGAGEFADDPCPVCDGHGRAHKRKKIKVKIPEGIDTGNHLRVKGQGNVGEMGAGKGDLIAVIYVEPHEIFKRDGNDIFMEVPVSFSESALGAEIEIPTLKGRAKLKVPSGTQSATLFKMKGKGIKSVNGSSYGDQFVKAIVKTPEKLNKKQKEIFEKLEKEEKLAKERKGIFGKLKGIFD